MQKLVEVEDAAVATLERYETALTHLQNFIKWKFKVSDLDVRSLNMEFVNDFDFWLKTVRRNSHNTSLKYIGQLKKMINLCITNGWLQTDPFRNFKMTMKEVKKEFLTEGELKIIQEKDFGSVRVNQVRDVFAFCCYTGLAYADIKKLARSEIVLGIDGEKWISIRRKKTDTPSRIPLLPPAISILEKYQTDPRCQYEGRLLPVYSNQKMNAYLKEIADVCSIEKKITFHMARFTFGTSITLGNGVPIETVSKMLGHKSLEQTQHYAKVLDKKVSEDMRCLRLKYASNMTLSKTGN
jgi:site-specific recombinase XerD